MSVRAIHNQYQGINAHLHSRLQAEGGWGDFHTRHIVHLADALTAQLRPLGYIARVEESLQIRRIDDTTLYPRADVLISDMQPRQPPSGAAPQAAAIPLLELVGDDLSDKPYRAVAIYAPNRYEQPVAWLELLSPTNKGNSDDADAYRAKRMNLLVAGLVFIELDYLHETPPTFPVIHPYTKQNGHRYKVGVPHPYRVIVLDPRPRLEEGWAQVEGFDVDQVIPAITIPLMQNGFRFELDAGYQRTFHDAGFGYDIDYSQLPINFDRYAPDDQARILRRMVAVCEAAGRGEDLEAGVLAVDESLDMDAAIERLKALATS